MDIRTAITLVEAMTASMNETQKLTESTYPEALTPFVKLAQKHTSVDRFLKATDGMDALYRGQSDGPVENNSFMTDYIGHAESYSDGIENVSAFAVNFGDVLFFNDQMFDALRAIYGRMPEQKFVAAYHAALVGHRHGAEFEGNGASIARKLIKSKQPYTKFSGDPTKNDAVIPLMQTFAREVHGKNIIAFLGNDYADYGGQNEFVVGDVSKLVDLRKLFAEVHAADRSPPQPSIAEDADGASGPEYFGGWRPEHGIDSWTERSFLEGNCGFLAAALAEATGWEIVAEHAGADGAHVWVVNDQGRAVDIQGVHPTSYAEFPGAPRKKDRNVEEVSLDSLLDMCWNKPVLEWARAIVAHFPEHFGIA